MLRSHASSTNGLFAGLDVGTTTTSLLVASARFLRNAVTGQLEIGEVQPVYRPDPVFTPFLGETLDIDSLTTLLDAWLEEAKLSPASMVAGGALVTGLAARAANAASVTRIVRQRF